MSAQSLRSQAALTAADLVLKVDPPIAFDACVRSLQILSQVATHFRAKGWPSELVASAFGVGAAIGTLVTALEEMGLKDPARFCTVTAPEVLHVEKPR